MIKDWREDYIICEHLTGNLTEDSKFRHYRFRVCCEDCYNIQDQDGVPTFLYGTIKIYKEGKLCIGRIAK